MSHGVLNKDGGLLLKIMPSYRRPQAEAPRSLTYASMVSRESVRIAPTLAALNALEVKTSDIQNAYLTASCSEKVYTTLGTAFGENKG